MALHIRLAPNEQLIINGVVVRNSDRQADLRIENNASILRGREIIAAGEAKTPVRYVQHILQLCLVSPNDRAALVPAVIEQLAEIEYIMDGTMKPHLDKCREAINAENFYMAFRELHPVSEREKFILSQN